MKNEEIINKAIEKARSNGWEPCSGCNGFEIIRSNRHEHGFYYQFLDSRNIPYFKTVEQIIFNHDFAKAFFGDGEHIFDGEVPSCEKCDVEYCSVRTSYCWQAYLHVMVTEEKPIKYLQEFLSQNGGSTTPESKKGIRT